MSMIITLLLALLSTVHPPADTLRVMFWNLENFFDWRNDSTSVSDAEFSSRGERHWTRKRFYTKCHAIAKGILWAGAQEGGVPDVIGFAEVENAFVLRRMLRETALRKLDYRLVHFDSPDRRGIDVALLYRQSRMKLAAARPCHLYAGDSIVATRDILLATFRLADDDSVAFLVNHHPSKYGGARVSDARRQSAVRRLRTLADSLQDAGIRNVVAMGDMNDTPDNPVYKELEPALRNLAEPLHRQGEGTIKYDGAWELIDMIFVSREVEAPPSMEILRIPFLMTRDAGHAGEKPLRTYSGPRYQGGVSDHCPVWVQITIGQK